MTLPATYTTAEVAAELKVTEWTVRQLARRHGVVPLRLSPSPNARMRFTGDHVAQLLAALQPPEALPRRRRRRSA